MDRNLWGGRSRAISGSGSNRHTWATHIRGDIKSYEIACEHATMLDPGPLGEIASALALELDTRTDLRPKKVLIEGTDTWLAFGSHVRLASLMQSESAKRRHDFSLGLSGGVSGVREAVEP